MSVHAYLFQRIPKAGRQARIMRRARCRTGDGRAENDALLNANQLEKPIAGVKARPLFSADAAVIADATTARRGKLSGGGGMAADASGTSREAQIV